MALICIQKCVFLPTWQNVIDNFARHSYTLRYSKDRKAMITLKASFCLHQPHRSGDTGDTPRVAPSSLGWCKTRFRLKQHEWSELAYRSKFLSQSWSTENHLWKPNMETNTWDLPDVSYGRLEVHSLNMSCEILLGCSDQTFLAETRTASLSSLMMLRDSCKSFQNDRVFFWT